MAILQNLREIMELSVAQVADELNVPRQDVLDAEETGSSYLLPAFIAAFPINPQILTDEDADPFLDSFDQTSPGDRMKRWRTEHQIPASVMAGVLGISEKELADFENGEGRPLNRRQGERIEKLTGINRKWLMYGDGRERGIPTVMKEPDREDEERTSRRQTPNREAGEKIRAARSEAGISREELSELLDLSVSRIAQMESGYIRDDKADSIVEQIREKSRGAMSAPGLRIREARKAAGLTLKAAANVVGITAGTLAAMESGRVSGKRAAEIVTILSNAPSAWEGGSARSVLNPDRNVSAGARIREERKQAGLSPKELATILRIPIPRLSAMELGVVSDQEAERIIARIHGAPRHEKHAKRVKASNKALLGWQLRDARKAAGFSQQEVGDLIGVSQGRISLMEKGQVDEETAAEIRRLIAERIREREERPEEGSEGEDSPGKPAE